MAAIPASFSVTSIQRSRQLSNAILIDAIQMDIMSGRSTLYALSCSIALQTVIDAKKMVLLTSGRYTGKREEYRRSVYLYTHWENCTQSNSKFYRPWRVTRALKTKHKTKDKKRPVTVARRQFPVFLYFNRPESRKSGRKIERRKNERALSARLATNVTPHAEFFFTDSKWII